ISWLLFSLCYPAEHRDESKLMVLHRETQTIEHKTFKDITSILAPVFSLLPIKRAGNTLVLLSAITSPSLRSLQGYLP
ncbi:MAG: S-adenosylmethionine:tRNA ribosyltransferase-isomerase, partial [Pseudomonadales bacterium]|nr:S-adenosylmethionine:tRNA ribosyltransferase-isomerase [Pseudomonadales bacterium]